MKTKEIIKRALQHPELFTEGELQYFSKMKELRKQRKREEKQSQSDYLS
jgi:hypothetical protein